MEICIIAEGSYPYVLGGVSSWIYQLIKELENKQFKVVSIMPSREVELVHKYPVPDNLVEIKTFYLDNYKQYNPREAKLSFELDFNQLTAIEDFFFFQSNLNWKVLFNSLGDRTKVGNVVEFLNSKLCWELLLKVYNQDFVQEGFNEFYWTLKSMLLFAINILQLQLPEADLYHAVSTGYAGLLGMLGKFEQETSFLLTEHGIYAREREEDILRATWVRDKYKQLWIDFFYFLAEGAYQTADKIVALFGRNRDIQLKLGASPERTRIVPNGVELANYSGENQPHSGLNVGAVLRVVPIKDVKTMLKAFRIVNERLEGVTLYIMGPTDENKDYYQECLALVERLGLQEAVIFTGQVDIKDYLKLMDLLVLTSLSEGQPLAILEGFAWGLPYVVTDVGSCRELIEGRADDSLGAAGLVTNPVSPQETAEAIIQLLENQAVRKQMGQVARKRVEKYYSKQQLMAAYRQIYTELGD